MCFQCLPGSDSEPGSSSCTDCDAGLPVPVNKSPLHFNFLGHVVSSVRIGNAKVSQIAEQIQRRTLRRHW